MIRLRLRLALGIALAAAVCGGWFAANRFAFHPTTFQYDYVAFYCASRVAQDGHDPYRTEPLRTCEHSAGHAFRHGSRLAVPAPVPGYDLAALAPLARLPFGVSSLVWLALQIAAYLLTIVTLARLTRCGLLVALAATLMSDAFLSILLGQLVPFALLGALLAADGLRRERYALATCGLGLLACEPHLALPVALGVAAFVPPARAYLAALGTVLIIASVALLGVAGNVEYFAAVLPAHAMAELSNQEQYSLSSLLHFAGAADAPALKAGEVSYGLMALGGIALGWVLRKRTGDAAPLVLAPLATAVFGGSFVHVQQFVVALPFALWLWSMTAAGRAGPAGSSRLATTGRPPAAFAAAAVALLAVPWGVFFALVPFAPIAAGCVAYLLIVLGAVPLARAALAGAATLGAISFAEVLRPPAGDPPNYALLGSSDGATLAETSWHLLMRSAGFHDSLLLRTAMKLPSWTAIAIVLGAGIVLAAAYGPVRAAAGERRPNSPSLRRERRTA